MNKLQQMKADRVRANKVERFDRVVLNNTATGSEQEFRIDEAAALLRHEKELGASNYVLPENSKYAFEDGKLIERTSPAEDKGTEKRKGNNSGTAKADQA